MRNAFRRPSTWILILALILLAIGVLWLLPRLLEPHPPPETNIASLGHTPEIEGGPEGSDPGEGTKAAGVDPSAASPTAEEDARAAPISAREPAESFYAPGRISGRIVDPAGHGVPGASVLALHAPDFGTPIEASSWWITHLPLDVADPIGLGAEAPVPTTTNEGGFFSFDDFEPGRVRLAVRSEMHDPLDFNDLWLAAGGEISLPMIHVERATFLSGRVFDPDDLPILGAPVVRVDDFAQAGLPPLSPDAGVLLGVTNELGYFRSIPIGVGPWSVAVFGGRDLVDASIAPASVLEGREFEATLPLAAKIRGRVRSGSRFTRPMVVRALPATAAMVGSARVPFSGRGDARVAEVLANSEFELNGLEPGVVYALRASESHRPWETDSVWSPSILYVAGEDSAELLWGPDASVTFRIVAPGTRQPLGDCLAQIAGFDPESARVAAPTEDTFGLSLIEGLRQKRISPFRSLTLSKEGFLSAHLDLDDLRPGRTHSFGDVELVSVPTMLVRAIDVATERPIENAEVRAVETPIEFDDPEFDFEAVTDAEGLARVRSFGGAGSGIEVRAPGYAPARRRGPFGSGFSETNLTIGLRRGATARVRVVDSAGNPVRAARIEHVEGSWSPNESWAETPLFEIGQHPDPRVSRVADERGGADFRHLAPGRHAFRFQRYGRYRDSEWTLRELAEGDVADIVLVGLATATLEVGVQDAGTALAGAPAALVRLEDAGDPVLLLDPRAPLPPCVSAVLDARGAARFSNLQPGHFLLLVQVQGQSVRASWEVSVAEGGSRQEIDLARRSIVGTVSHAESGPVEGAAIRIGLWSSTRVRRNVSVEEFLATPDDGEPDVTRLDIPATSTDLNGDYRILGLPEDLEYFVTAQSGEHWRKGSGPIRLDPIGVGTRADLSVDLVGAIEVHVGRGSRIVPCAITAFSRGSVRPRMARTFSGSVEVLEAIPPGAWEVYVGGGGQRIRSASVDVVAGETAVVQIALP